MHDLRFEPGVRHLEFGDAIVDTASGMQNKGFWLPFLPDAVDSGDGLLLFV